MAEIPVPRSFPQIIGDMEDAFLSSAAGQGVANLRAGSPLLSIFECAAQSDMRSSQDIFDLLSSFSLDNATGVALVRIGAEEGVFRLAEAPSTGTVDIYDGSFTRMATKIYQGLPAPIVGTDKIFVADATDWPPVGDLYIGRGTSHYEGKLQYASIENKTTHYEITLAQPVTKPHDMGEPVILANRGNRTIGSGCVVKTPQANILDAVEFHTVDTVVIPDGETGVQGVRVVAAKPGRVGDVPAGAISQFSSAPFDGAIVTNTLPFGNSRETETDANYRDRIRAARKTRTKGTTLALTTAVSGITAPDENRRVSSASLVARAGQPTTLYIDDGTGYEESSAGVAVEVLTDSAVGGEQYFQTRYRPIAKAFLMARNVSPYSLPVSASIEVRVGGLTYTHHFDPVDFVSPSSATAYEVVASINANEQLAFHARSSNSGTRVVLSAKTDVNEDLEVTGGTVSDVFLFPAGVNYTLQLYKTDRLLVKDGRKAILYSNLFGAWNTPPEAPTLLVTVDGTIPLTITFTNQDFIDAETGYNQVARNSLAAWVKVLNRKIPGVTARVDSGRLELVSNAGEKASASIEITGGTLVTARLFSVSKVQGQAKDYVLDRNTGQLRLETPLSAGDRLSIGSANTRGFIESGEIGLVSTLAPASLWFSVDGDATRIAHGLSSVDPITITVVEINSWGYFRIITATVPAFINVREGDWMICYDPSAHVSIQGHFRVSQVDPAGTWIKIERNDAPMITSTTMSLSTPPRLVFVRTLQPLQRLVLPAANNYSASSLVTFLNEKLVGATASTYKTNRLRITTNSQGLDGDIALVAADDLAAATFKLPIGNATDNLVGHIASLESGNPETGTPTFADFELTTVANAPGSDYWGTATATSPSILPLDFGGGHQLVGVRNRWDGGLVDRKRFGSTLNLHLRSHGFTPSSVFLRAPPQDDLLKETRFYAAAPFAIGPEDDLMIQVDDDLDRRFAVPMWRSLKSTNADAIYSGTNSFKDADANAPLAKAFGLSYPFEDFTVYMHSRAVVFDSDADKRALIRWYKFGPDGDNARVRFASPLKADAQTTIVVDNHDLKTNVRIHLPSGEARTPSLRTTTKLAYALTQEIAGAGTFVFALGFIVTTAQRNAATDRTVLVIQLPDQVESCGLSPGNSIYLHCPSHPVDFLAGVYVVAEVAVSSGPGLTQEVVITDTTPGDVLSTVLTGGILSLDIKGVASFAASPGDYLRINNAVSLGLDWYYEDTTFKVSAVSALYQHLICTSEAVVPDTSVSPILDIAPLLATSNLQLFGQSATTITALALAIKTAHDAPNSTCPITMKVLGTGNGEVDEPTPWVNLTDGVNWVSSVAHFPASVSDADHYQLAFKKPINSTLSVSMDWLAEEVRICPTTTANVVAWLGTPAVTGLSSSCLAQASSNGAKIQLASVTPGAVGSIHVQGGKVNAVNVPVVGEGLAVPGPLLDPIDKGISTVSKSLAAGLMSGMWVSIDNTNTLTKPGIFTTATKLASWSASGLMTFDTAGALELYKENLAPAAKKATFNSHGNFVAVSFTDAEAGEFLSVTVPVTPSVGWTALQVPTPNQGIFRIVRSQAGVGQPGTVWIENPEGVDGTFEGVFGIYADRRDLHDAAMHHSVLPGDELVINTSLWGAENKGRWVVERVGVANATTTAQFTTPLTLKVRVSDRTPRAITVMTAPLGTQVAAVHVVEGKPSRFIKRIEGIAPHPDNGAFVDIRWDNSASVESISAQAGSVIHALDKLEFSTDLAVGNDAYEYNTGLIAEANRIIYGDPRNSSAYPGVAAAGAVVNINGPIVKRLKIALQLRVRTGASGVDIVSRVRSAVAGFVNKTGVGQPVAISALIAAASQVGGVISVTVISPTFNSENDLFSIQPFEKPMIVQPTRDIQITFAGD